MITQEIIDEHRQACADRMAQTPEGPWSKEPHRVEFKHAGFDCMLIRNAFSLHWCGYVGLPPEHPCFGKDYDDVPIDVHGGVTYARGCEGIVCHLADNKDEQRYWVGWDFAHGGDCMPGHLALMEMKDLVGLREIFGGKAHYWTMDEVMTETKKAAEQLAKAAA